jgi:hypothetical protein
MSLRQIQEQNPVSPISEVADDFFICATSFEDRSRRAVELLSSSYRVENALMVFYRDTLNVTHGRKNVDFIANKLEKHASHMSSIICDFRNAYSIIIELEKKIGSGKLDINKKYFTIDISCFTKLHLLLLLRYLSRKTKGYFRFLYSEPLTYGTIERTLGDRKVGLSYGFLEMITINYKMNSAAIEKKGETYIIFLGHEFERTYQAFKLLEPERFWVLKGSPGFSLQLELWSNKVNEILINDPYDVENCLNDLLKVEKNIASLNFVPCGTKLQALGIFLFAQNLKDCNLIISYPMPLRYEEKNFSRGFGKTWMTLWTNL